MDVHKIALVSASLGSIDKQPGHVPQSIEYDCYYYTDRNFLPRRRSMTPRLQAKIPKFFAWQMAPGHDYYLWLDSNISMAHEDTIKYLREQCEGYDIVVLRHPRRPTVWKEARYTEQGLDEQSTYLLARYENELLYEQMEEIHANKDFVDDLLVNGGIFMYRNTRAVHAMFKEWWYHVSRYIIQDQISFAYVLKTSGLRVNVLDEVYNDSKYFRVSKHNQRI